MHTVLVICNHTCCSTGRVLKRVAPRNTQDTMGALALATEDPNPELLLMKPYGRNENLITRIMWKHILVQGGYQIFWMFFILYGATKLLDDPKYDGRYDIEKEFSYWARECPADLTEAGIPGNSTVAYVCNIMNVCGFPYQNGDDSKNSPACNLYRDYWSTVTPPRVPSDPRAAMCWGTDAECDLFQAYKSAEDTMKEKYQEHSDLEYRPALSVLFNTFIFCQIFNEINARRINDEYTIFHGLFSNPIFVGVIIITIGFQVIIINVPFVNTKFFKVEPLLWQEWLITIAIGFGAIPLSLLTRFLSKHMPENCLRGTRVHASQGRTLSGKPVGRTVSGRTVSGRTASALHSPSGRLASKQPV